MTEQDPADPQRREAIARLLSDIRAARAAGKEIDDATICESHRHLMPELGAELEKLRRIHAARRAAAAPPPPPPPTDPTTDDHIPTALINDLETPNIQVPGYSILREISRGGQAAVYLATQLSTGRKIALKLMHDGPFASDRAITRFRREVQALAALNHPNIVAIIDTGKTAEGARFIAMNYIAGANLSDYMKDRLKKDPTDPSKLLRLFLKICDAVNAAHRLGIIHRDLKPSNIRVDERGEPHILDFGLARTALDHALGAPDHAVSVTGEFLGSLPWSSPEQAEGSPDKIDIRTDVYSLGVILYQILTAGRFPYAVVGNIRDVLNNILTADPTPPSKILPVKQLDKTQNILPKHPLPSINEAIEKIVLKALAKKPEHRYPSAGDLGRDIARYLAGQRTAAKEPERPEPSIPPPKRPSITTMIAAATVILAVIILGLSLLHASHPLSPNLPTAPPASQPSLALNPSTASTTTPSSIAATGPAAPPERRFPVYAFQGNGWKIQGDELVQTLSGKHQFLVFGDPAWSNYNFTFKALVDEDVRGGICPIFHWTEGNNYERFVIGAFEGTAFDFNYFTNGQQHRHPGDFLRAGFTYHHWYDVRIEVRGPEIRCLLDGVEYVHRTYNDYSSGRVGLEIYGCVSHFRDIRVVAPDGTLLLSGPPILPPESQSEALAPVDSSKPNLSAPNLLPPREGKTFTALADIFNPNDAKQFQVDPDGTMTVVDSQKGFLFAGTTGKDFAVSGEMYMDSGDDNQVPTGIKPEGRVRLCVRTFSGAYWLNGKSIGTNRMVEGQEIHQYREISHLGQPDKQWLNFRFEVTAAGIRAAVGTATGEIKGPLSTDGKNYLMMAPGAKLRNLSLTIIDPTDNDNPENHSPAPRPLASGNWTPLFNGKNLDGWEKGDNLNANWRVENGILIGSLDSSPVGSLFTVKDTYKNFRYRVETMLAEGGVGDQFLHTLSGPKGYNALLGGTGADAQKIGYIEWGGKNVAHSTPPAISPGEWFTQDLIVQNGRATVLLNGQKVSEYSTLDAVNQIGKLGIQCMAHSLVRFKSIEVQELPDISPPIAPRPTSLAATFPMTPEQAKKIQRDYAAATGLPITTSLALDSTNSIQFVLVPPGQFQMGLLTDRAPPPQEAPHHVTLTHAFYLAVTPITVAQFAAFIQQSNSQPRAEIIGGAYVRVDGRWKWVAGASWRNPGFEQSPNDPVTTMSWTDTVAFCEWLSKSTGRQVRIPTCAEWEHACRAGSSTYYFFGDNKSDLEKAAWYVANSGGKTHPVAQKIPNAWGLYDMYGNASQWCQDWYAETMTPEAGAADAVDPHGPETGLGHIKRGGSWLSPAYVCSNGQSFERNTPVGVDSTQGFRVLLEVPSPIASGHANALSSNPRTIDLLKLLDLSKDTAAGTWTFDAEGLHSPGLDFNAIEFPYEPPAEYDYSIVFAKVHAGSWIQVLCDVGKQFAWVMGHNYMGFSAYKASGDGKYYGPQFPENPTHVRDELPDADQVTWVLQVRKNHARILIDGREIESTSVDYSTFNYPHPFPAFSHAHTVGICAKDVPLFIKSAQITEIAGQGKLLRLSNPSVPLAPGASLTAPADLFSPDDLALLHIDPAGVITVDQKAELTLRNTVGRNFIISGEMYLNTTDDNNFGGVALWTRAANPTHRYELTGKYIRAKRLLLNGQLLSGISEAIPVNLPDHQWIPFRFNISDAAINAKLGGQSATLHGPLTTIGDNILCLASGAKLRNLSLSFH